MSFRVTARTLLHLGAELISSDTVALFELVKNAFDAGSPRVSVEVIVRIPHQKIGELLKCIPHPSEDIGTSLGECLETLRIWSLNSIDPTSPNSKDLRHSVEQAKDLNELREVLRASNYLVVSDTGAGMSLDTLNDVFLTIGTRSRHAARERHRAGGLDRPILGEKGVGRLSAMRLGTQLQVETSTSTESNWNLLDIDWSVFSHESDALLDAFTIEARRGRQKDNPSVSGTRVVISDLTSLWTKETMGELARKQFTKLTDPFTDHTLFPVELLYNGERVPIPRFNRVLIENAHATVHATFERNDDRGMRLFGITRYKDREQAFSIEDSHLMSTSDSPMALLESLGPFELEIYWYNRRILTALEGVGDRRTVLDLVRRWGGGVMVFRDGFRVLPYGGPDDDWLDLDRRAFASSGYKVNRTQVLGRLKISSAENPALTDQTNREGLRDCEEKNALRKILWHVFQSELRTFLDKIDGEIKAREPIFIEELERRVEEEEQQIQENVSQLIRKVPEMVREQPLINAILEAVERLSILMTDVRDVASSFEAGRDQLLNLAGIGLTVEVLAHELNRATDHTLRTLADISDGNVPTSMETTAQLLEAQLKTLQRRLRVLDPLSTSGRQRKETFDVVAVVQNMIEDHRERFARDQVTCILVVKPEGKRHRLRVRAVKGMIIQVLGNLIDNSVYWLRQQRTLNPTHKSTITIAIDTEAKQLSVTDNGPGIAISLKERVFEAFFTTKPAGQGKGLGLFIAREIASYHGAKLYLKEPAQDDQHTCHTFVLNLGEM
ncbi:MAG: sensor histidine kinase [Caldilineaceae bacterium]|nr:sensor histidine kinase [Caldilineaceae bacterium]